MSEQNDDLLIRIGLTEKQYMQALARMESASVKAANKNAKAFTTSNKSFQSGAAKSNRAANNFANGGLHNMSLQFSQVMQQGAVTGDYMRSLAVQLPDMAMGFGTLAVAAGALAPILISVGAGMLKGAADAKDAEEALKSLNSALSDFESAKKAAQTGFGDMVGQYGVGAASQARELLQIQQELAGVNLTKELSNAASTLSEASFGDFGEGTADQWRELGVVAEEYTTKLKEAKAASDTYAMGHLISEFGDAVDAIGVGTYQLDKIKDEFSVTYIEAARLAGAFSSLENADGAEEQARAAENLREALRDAAGGVENMSDDTRALFEQLLNVEDAALRVAAVDIGANIRSATVSAGELKQTLREIAALGAAAQAESDGNYGGRGGDPRQFGGSFYDWNNREGTAFLDNYEDPKKKKSSSGKSIQEEIESLRSSLDPVYSATQTYEKAQALLNKALQIGAIDLATYNSTMDLATAKFEEATKQAELFDVSAQSIGETLLDVAMNGADAFDSLAQSIQKAALEYALFGSGGVSSLGTSDAGGLIGGWLSGLFEANAKGGVYSSPSLSAYSGSVVSSPTTFAFAKGAGLMGEDGAEGIFPLTRGADGKLGVAAHGMSGGGTTVQVNNYSGAKVETTTETGPDGKEMVRLMVSDEIGKGSFDKSMGGRYGSTVRKTKR